VLALILLLVSSPPPLGANASSGPSPTTIATTVVSLVTKGDFAAERYFSPALQAAAPAARLQQIWQQLTAQLGAFQR
jgi:hypothetical protein